VVRERDRRPPFPSISHRVKGKSRREFRRAADIGGEGRGDLLRRGHRQPPASLPDIYISRSTGGASHSKGDRTGTVRRRPSDAHRQIRSSRRLLRRVGERGSPSDFDQIDLVLLSLSTEFL
jgi:hypothetical protein